MLQTASFSSHTILAFLLDSANGMCVGVPAALLEASSFASVGMLAWNALATRCCPIQVDRSSCDSHADTTVQTEIFGIAIRADLLVLKLEIDAGWSSSLYFRCKQEVTERVMALGTIYSLKVTIIAAVGVMVGVVAAVMGFSAERKRITADKMVWMDNENRCYIPPNQTVSLSIMAGLLLLLSQVGFTVAGGCLCCNRNINKFTGPARLAIKSLILSWASSIVAVICFCYGAGVSSNHHARVNAKRVPAATSASCGYVINAGVFAGAALIALVGTLAGATYYLAVSRMQMLWADHIKPEAPGGIELGLPTAHPAVPAATLRTV